MGFSLGLSKEAWVKVGKGALVAGAGAVMTYLATWASGQDFGAATPVIMAALSVVANIIRKYATEAK